jgi:hypothetical protein
MVAPPHQLPLQLIALTKGRQATQAALLDWLQVEFDVATPSQRLRAVATLDEAAFIEEVRRLRPRSRGRLTPSALAALRQGYRDEVAPLRERMAEAWALEERLSDLVNAAYGLTPAEVDLLWRTAPPRMPLASGQPSEDHA